MALYSERLVASSSGGVWTFFTVPSSKRAVVRAVDIVNPSGVAATVQIHCGVYGILFVALPATPGSYQFRTRAVAYAGEVVGAFPSVSGVYVSVSGYLFDDQVGARAPDLEVDESPPWLAAE